MKSKLLSLIFLFVVLVSHAQIPEEKLDALIQNTIKTFDVPGMSVGILKDGKTVYSKGFGVRSLHNNQPMNESTLVGIASNSKGFTCFALGMLIDEGKINWDDKVTKHLPDFRMYDAFVTQEITIRDLVTHRAGLGLGQGDLMFFPEGGNLTESDIVHRVRYLKPQHSFRNTMDYNNIMFIVAGEVIRKVSGLSWAEFIEQKILKPVGMKSSFGSYNRVQPKSNIIDAHAPVNGKAIAVPHDWNETANAAGGIMSNIPDMLTWAEFLMNGGVTKDGKRLLSEKQMNELWQIQSPIPVAAKTPYNTKFNGYGLGWFISDMKGQRQVQHSGGLIGTVTHFTLLPEMKLAIVVLTNQQSGAAFGTITNTVKDAYLGIEDRNWLKTNNDRMTQYFTKIEKSKKEIFDKVEWAKKNPNSVIKFEQILGTYKDEWFGDVVVSKEGASYRMVCLSSPRLKGEILPYNATTFVVKWDDRSYDADVFATFNLDENGKAQSLKLKALSDITDFSFDFQNLDLKRVEK
ncbi:MAG: serine hydrolase [Cloacibacterium sp.]|nr:serine hydrolase [Cloacibacterium sp.]